MLQGNIFLFLGSIALYVVSIVLSLILRSKPKENIRLTYALTALASLLLMLYSLDALLSPGAPVIVEGIRVPGLQDQFGAHGFFALYVDKLSAFLLLVISFVALYSSIFSIGYSEMYAGEYSISYLTFFYALFVLSMVLVVTANDALSFYLSWELMTLSSYMLVGYEHRSEESRDAAKTYFIIAHAGGACILLSYALLYFIKGSLSFDAFREGGVPPGIASLIFLLALVGFGSKAGIVPLHAWLPQAHPAAPSNVSALLSGVMLKVAVYGLIRVVFDFLKPSGVEGGLWGCAVMIIAAFSTIIGVQFAVVQHDLKRLLAYHSIENIGIILLGVGASLILYSEGLKDVAALALTAALYHLLNHAVFKSLLFLGSGSVLKSCRTRNFELLGGLSKYLPWTSVTFLIAAMAIAGVPPLNGFASEWLTYQSLLAVVKEAAGKAPWVSLAALFSALMLGLAGALAVLCFTKVYGVTFLGPLGRVKPKGGESLTMKIGMAIPAAACIVLGVAMPYVAVFVDKASRQITGAPAPLAAPSPLSLVLESNLLRGEVSLPGLAAALVILVAAAGLALGLRRLKITRTPPWVSGVEYEPEAMKPTATAYASQVRGLFARLYGVTVKEHREYSVPPIYTRKLSYEVEMRPKIEAYAYVKVEGPPTTTQGTLARLATLLENSLYAPFAKPIAGILEARPAYKEKVTYAPLAKLALKLGLLVRKVQAGALHIYMFYILVMVVLLLVLGVVLP
ncbi:NADH dehydrogenase (quinone) [Thermofilum pendens Hrk 5]|uniref:NADH dehydrogenase (Quinone) n=1 Tax=Thermofilum pendens (strain DSM 2475 / Hrk 5) TaxID=368408 RepID=A1RWL8_THEPD|nr:NADH dehydrogenase (quinone) [Thermofilum pendens Hrk 5]